MNSLHKKIYQLQTADVSARKTKNIICRYLCEKLIPNSPLPPPPPPHSKAIIFSVRTRYSKLKAQQKNFKNIKI